jgi:hypothetical protein
MNIMRFVLLEFYMLQTAKSNGLLQHAFRNLARMLFKNLEFVVPIFHQLESESISFFLGQSSGSEPDQRLISVTAIVPYRCVQAVQNNNNLTAGITTDIVCHHLDIPPKS